MNDQPTLTDGVVTLRPWRDSDVAQAVAGHDEVMADWLGSRETSTEEGHQSAIDEWRQGYADQRKVVAFAIETDRHLVGGVEVQREGTAGGSLRWTLYRGHRGKGHATRAVRLLADWCLTPSDKGGLGLLRVEARVDPDNKPSLRVATRSGMHREGVHRVVPGMGDRPEAQGYVVLSRLATDPPITEPEAFRTLLNSFLPRKRAIGQMLIRDPDDRVLLCQLTYKRDWDLPGGVVEVGESPRDAVTREVEEELGLTVAAGKLLVTDWLPPWGGWDDAICLVFDGGTHHPHIVDTIVKQAREIKNAEFCTIDQIRERCADFTARRIESALDPNTPGYLESGR